MKKWHLKISGEQDRKQVTNHTIKRRNPSGAKAVEK